MRIEVSDNVFWIGICLIVAVLTGYIVRANLELDKEYIKAGYTKTMLVGSDFPKWVKIAEK